MLRQIETARAAFSLQWVKLSIARKDGGQIKKKESLLLYRKGGNGQPYQGKKNGKLPKKDFSRKQFFNLQDPDTGEFFKVYKRLITRFNGLKVVY